MSEAGYVLLRLPLEVRDIFKEFLEREYPDRAKHVLSVIRSMRGGKDYDAEWGKRMTGDGPHAWQIGRRFEIAARRLGLNGEKRRLRTDLFQPPDPGEGAAQPVLGVALQGAGIMPLAFSGVPGHACRPWQRRQSADSAEAPPPGPPTDRYERAARKRGAALVAGVDEAGRGPLAGPVVVAAVVFDGRRFPTRPRRFQEARSRGARGALRAHPGSGVRSRWRWRAGRASTA